MWQLLGQADISAPIRIYEIRGSLVSLPDTGSTHQFQAKVTSWASHWCDLPMLGMDDVLRPDTGVTRDDNGLRGQKIWPQRNRVSWKITPTPTHAGKIPQPHPSDYGCSSGL
jgi:hypothetical protein